MQIPIGDHNNIQNDENNQIITFTLLKVLTETN